MAFLCYLWAVAPVIRTYIAIENIVACCVCRPGLAPAGDSLSFASPKESKQRKGDPQSGSLCFASGDLSYAVKAGVCANSPAAQTARSPDPAFAATPRPSQDGAADSDTLSFLVIPDSIRDPSPLRSAWIADQVRNDGAGFGVPGILVSSVQPLESRRGAQGKAGKGWHCLSRRRVLPDPVLTEHRSVPGAQRRDDEQGRLSLGYFSLAKQRKVTSRRATPGLLVKGNSANPPKASTSSARTVMCMVDSRGQS